jgi:hypothetical protein
VRECGGQFALLLDLLLVAGKLTLQLPNLLLQR